MSYNNIGLATARGTGTNGYISRNLSTLKNPIRKNINHEEAVIQDRKPNMELLEHEAKRRIEIKVLEYADTLDGLNEEEIQAKCDEYRNKLILDFNPIPDKARPHQVHEVAVLKEKANKRFADALRIGKDEKRRRRSITEERGEYNSEKRKSDEGQRRLLNTSADDLSTVGDNKSLTEDGAIRESKSNYLNQRRRSISPPRRTRRDGSRSPRRGNSSRRQRKDVSASPSSSRSPPRRTRRYESRSPRRGQRKDRSASPRRAGRDESRSPRRGNSSTSPRRSKSPPKRTKRDESRSPRRVNSSPRLRKVRSASPSSSRSPPRRTRREVSRSPRRGQRKDRSFSPSNSRSPPRRTRREVSRSPRLEQRKDRSASLKRSKSPSRRTNIDISPPRRHKKDKSPPRRRSPRRNSVSPRRSRSNRSRSKSKSKRRRSPSSASSSYSSNSDRS